MNARLGEAGTSASPRDLVQFLFEYDGAFEVAQSIAVAGFFPNEPLLVVEEEGRLVVVEGNRRLAALKALKDPHLLQGPIQKRVAALADKMASGALAASVPIVIAPDRKSTNGIVAGRHIGTPVRAWEAENRAAFVLARLKEGYTDEEMKATLGLSASDIADARRTRAIVEMAKALDLPEDVREKVHAPRATYLSTLKRVIETEMGRKHLGLEPDAKHGLRGVIPKAEFLKGFSKLVSDLASDDDVNSRSLNTKEDIDRYFKKLKPSQRPKLTKGSFTPADITSGAPSAPDPALSKPANKVVRDTKVSTKGLPRDFKIAVDNTKLIKLGIELRKLDRTETPMAVAFAIRVFLELSIKDYLDRRGHLEPLNARLAAKGTLNPKFGTATLAQMAVEIRAVVKDVLTKPQLDKLGKALTGNQAQAFSIGDLNTFMHRDELPVAGDIEQFWHRIDPLMRLMLMHDTGKAK
jgi:hypothetical protein